MERGIAPAVKSFGVVLLRAMIGQRLSGHLPSRNAASVSEDGQHQRVDVGALLKNIENFIHTFIYERNCSDLDRDELLVLLRLRRRRRRGERFFFHSASRWRRTTNTGHGDGRDPFQEVTS